MITLFCLSMTDLKESFFFFTSETFHNLGEYLKIGFPSAMMLCLEWGGLESLIIIAGFISVNASAVQVIALNSFLVIMMIPIGF
jgi:MATE family multidrug resistance protein